MNQDSFWSKNTWLGKRTLEDGTSCLFLDSIEGKPFNADVVSNLDTTIGGKPFKADLARSLDTIGGQPFHTDIARNLDAFGRHNQYQFHIVRNYLSDVACHIGTSEKSDACHFWRMITEAVNHYTKNSTPFYNKIDSINWKQGRPPRCFLQQLCPQLLLRFQNWDSKVLNETLQKDLLACSTTVMLTGCHLYKNGHTLFVDDTDVPKESHLRLEISKNLPCHNMTVQDSIELLKNMQKAAITGRLRSLKFFDLNIKTMNVLKELWALRDAMRRKGSGLVFEALKFCQHFISIDDSERQVTQIIYSGYVSQ